MSTLLTPPDDYSLSADGRTITLIEQPLDYSEYMAYYELPDAQNRAGDTHGHAVETKRRWNEQIGETAWALAQDYVAGSLQVFKSGNCGYPHTHQTDSFTGNGAQTSYTLSLLPMAYPEVLVAGVFKHPITDYTWTAETQTLQFLSAPANAAAISVQYASIQDVASPATPHLHFFESQTDWSGGTGWALARIPDKQVTIMVRDVGGVISFPVLNTDYFIIGNLIQVLPQPAPTEKWYFFYSYCINATLEGITFFITSDPADDPIQTDEPAPAGSVVTYEDGTSVGWPAGGSTLPFVGPSGAAGSVTTITITYPDGTKKTLTFLIATMYLHDSLNNRLYKIINNRSPRLLTHPTLVGRTWCKVAPSNKDIVYAFDTGAKANSNVYKSIDGGASWTTVAVVPGNTDGRILGVGVIDRNDPDVVYVPNRKTSGALEFAVYKTTNGGTTWTGMLAGINPENRDIDCVLAMHHSDSQKLLLATDDAYLTTDGGAAWTQCYTATSANDIALAASFAADPYAFIMTRFVPFHVRRSTDGGATFSNAVVFQDLATGTDLARENADGAVIAVAGGTVRYSGGGGLFVDSGQGALAPAVSATVPTLFVIVTTALTGGNHASTSWSLNGSVWHAHQTWAGHDWQAIGVV